MKKLFIIISSALALFAVSPANAQTAKQTKEAKTMARQDKKEGYKCEDGDLVTLLAKFYIAKRDEGKETMFATAIANESRFKNLARRIATVNAATEYSYRQRAFIKGKVEIAAAEIAKQQQQKFIEAYESKVINELSGQLKTAAWVVRKDPTNPKQLEVKGYFYIDPEAARQAHLDALRAAASEQQLINELGDSISNWINGIPFQQDAN